MGYYPQYAVGTGIYYTGVKPVEVISDYAPGGYYSRKYVAEKTGLADTRFGQAVGRVDTGARDLSRRIGREGVGWIQRDQDTTLGALNDRVMAYVGLADRTEAGNRTLERDVASLNSIIESGKSLTGSLRKELGEARKIGDAENAMELTQKLNAATRRLEEAQAIKSRAGL